MGHPGCTTVRRLPIIPAYLSKQLPWSDTVTPDRIRTRSLLRFTILKWRFAACFSLGMGRCGEENKTIHRRRTNEPTSDRLTSGRKGGLFDLYSPDGEKAEWIPMPDLLTTNICFGGEDLKTAYITLSTTGKLVSCEWKTAGLPLNFLNTD